MITMFYYLQEESTQLYSTNLHPCHGNNIHLCPVAWRNRMCWECLVVVDVLQIFIPLSLLVRNFLQIIWQKNQSKYIIDFFHTGFFAHLRDSWVSQSMWMDIKKHYVQCSCTVHHTTCWGLVMIFSPYKSFIEEDCSVSA